MAMPITIRAGSGWQIALLIAWLAAGCGPGAGEAEPADWTLAADRVRPSVHSVWGSKPALGGEFTAFGPVGTSFAISSDGVLLTGAHVVAGANGSAIARLHVLLQTDSGAILFPSTILGLDMQRDLALLEIEDSALTPVRWSSGRAPMGLALATIGYGLPEGGVVDTAGSEVTSRYTVFRRFTAGHSSGYRTLVPGDPSTNVLEVDLFLFPGVSGGPTFDREGRVIGVNQGQHRYRDGGPTSYGRVIPRLVVGQFLELHGTEAGLDSASVFGGLPDDR